MKVYILSYEFSMTDTAEREKAKTFCDTIKEQLDLYGVENYFVGKANYKKSVSELNHESIVVCINGNVNENEEFYKAALKNKSIIYPVALSKDCRVPHKSISDKQSFDVYEQLRCRDLSDEFIGIAAKVFARKLISKCSPSVYHDNFDLFLSHRRLDGEEITAGICDAIKILAPNKKVFRDVININIGESAQDIIDSGLAGSDVLVFFHTRKASESDWVLKEVFYAITHNIPVLWVKVGDADIDSLKYRPSEKPHLEYSADDFEKSDKRKMIADEILDHSFRLLMENGNDVYDDLMCTSELFDGKMSVLDRTNMIYSLSYPRKGYTYPQRTISQLVQFLGRNPQQADIERMSSELDKHHSFEFDSAVILSKRTLARKVGDRVLLDNYDDFYHIYQRYINGCETEKNDDIVISGAFPDCDEIYKQSLTYALVCFVREILKEGYNLCFGAHPTFQELIFETAKSITPNYKNKVRMYISDLFIRGNDIQNFSDKCTLFNVAGVDSDLALSLTELRKKMISRDSVKALICLGGKIKGDKSKEGIREEIDVARKKGIPVFLIGSVGGCSAEIAKEYCINNDWNKLNSVSSVINRDIALGIDYKKSARTVMECIKSMEEH